MELKLRLLPALMLLGACSIPSPAPGTPAPAPATSTAVPTALSAEDAILATLAAAPQPTRQTVAQPTAFPTITLGPTAQARPLAPGWWDSAVCYEVFVRSFSDSDGDGIGDLSGLIARLDYINDGDPATGSDLGANCIWLMPVAEASSYHGYDTMDYYTIEQDYGTNEDFKNLVAESHRRGISVIIDLVLNHVSSQHPWFVDALNNPQSQYRDWFIWSERNPGYAGPWGEQVWHPAPGGGYYYGIFTAGMPDLNYRNPAVTAEAERIGAFWLNEIGVDGFRFDAVKHVVEAGREQENTRETHAWLREYAAFLREAKPGAFSVGEIFGGQPGVLDAYYPDQLDTYFEFATGEGILDAALSGSGRDFLRPAVAAYQRLPFQRYATFLTNHDQERTMTALGGDAGRARVAAIALLTTPGLPFIYYGEEIGMSGAKPDERIRTPMQWEAGPGAGFTAGRPWEAPQPDAATVHVAAQDGDDSSLLNLYRQLIRLRLGTPALARGGFTALEARGDPALAAFVRQQGGQAVLVVINWSDRPLGRVDVAVATSDLEPGTYRLTPVFGSAPATELVVEPGGLIAGSTVAESLAPYAGAVFALELR
jgi:alpha-amylase